MNTTKLNKDASPTTFTETEKNWSTEYSKFKLLKFNRTISRKKVDQLKELIDKYGFLVPIIVDESGNVIDGQHRLIAAKELKTSFSFVVLSVDTSVLPYLIAELNSSFDRWKQNNYLEMWASLGKSDYARLSQLMLQRGLHFRELMTLTQVRADNVFKEGDFVFTKDLENRVNRRIGYFNDIMTFNNYLKQFADNKKFRAAVALVVRHPKYDHEKMLRKLQADHNFPLKGCTTVDYVDRLEEIYNKTLSKNRIKFSRQGN